MGAVARRLRGGAADAGGAPRRRGAAGAVFRRGRRAARADLEAALAAARAADATALVDGARTAIGGGGKGEGASEGAKELARAKRWRRSDRGNWAEEIDTDVVRTFPRGDAPEGAEGGPAGPAEAEGAEAEGAEESGFEGRGWEEKTLSARRVLRGVAVRCPLVRYCQGMNIVAAFLLWACAGDERAAFAVLVGLVERHGMADMWRPGLYRLHFCLFALQRIVAARLPALAAHLAAEGVRVGMFASRWFLTLFTSRELLRPEVARRLWDLMLLDHVGVLLAAAFAILEIAQDALRDKDFTEMLRALRTPRRLLREAEAARRGAAEDVDVDLLLLRRAAEIHVSEQTIQDLEAEYHLAPPGEEDGDFA